MHDNLVLGDPYAKSPRNNLDLITLGSVIAERILSNTTKQNDAPRIKTLIEEISSPLRPLGQGLDGVERELSNCNCPEPGVVAFFLVFEIGLPNFLATPAKNGRHRAA